jgi:hypothetical protein
MKIPDSEPEFQIKTFSNDGIMERADNDDIENYESKEKDFQHDESNTQEIALDETTLNVNVTFIDIGHKNISQSHDQIAAEKPAEENKHDEPDQPDDSTNDNSKPKPQKLARLLEDNKTLGEQPDQQKHVYR